MKDKTMANIDVSTSTDVKKIEALTNLSQNFSVLRETNSGGKLYHCVCRHILLDRKPQRHYITYKELVNNIKYEPLLQQWVNYQTKHGNNKKKKELNSTQCTQGNKTWGNKYKYQKWHKTNKRSNLCENIDFEVFPVIWTELQQQQEHSEGVLHNGAKNWTKRNEMRKMLFKKQNMHEINILANLCYDIDFEDFSGIWSALQQQQDHSEGILHNGAKNGTRRKKSKLQKIAKQS